MNLWIFPGQPLQAEQMAPDEHLQAIAELCIERCGYDLMEGKPCAGISLSKHTSLQIHGVAISLYRSKILRESGKLPDMLAEHSLGIYAALAVSGSISEGDALELAARIGGCMSQMGEQRDYSLGCPIGLAAEQVESSARNNGVHVANYNTSRHFLLAGEKAAMESAMAECRAIGAFSATSFDCEAPLHTPLMAGITRDLCAITGDYHFTEPQMPLMESLRQTVLQAADIRNFLVQELQQPVYWERTWKKLRGMGVAHCTEVGSGRALTKFNRWIDSENI